MYALLSMKREPEMHSPASALHGGGEGQRGAPRRGGTTAWRGQRGARRPGPRLPGSPFPDGASRGRQTRQGPPFLTGPAGGAQDAAGPPPSDVASGGRQTRPGPRPARPTVSGRASGGAPGLRPDHRLCQDHRLTGPAGGAGTQGHRHGAGPADSAGTTPCLGGASRGRRTGRTTPAPGGQRPALLAFCRSANHLFSETHP